MTVAGDPLGRGWLTRWMPVFWRSPSLPPDTPPFQVAANTTPTGLLRAVMFSAKRYTIPAAALSALHQVGEALVPLIAGAAIDQALATGDLGLLLFWLTLLAVTFLGLSLGFRFAAQLTALAITHAQHRLRVTLSRRVLHPTGSASASRPDGGVVSAMTNDVSRVGALWLVVFPLGEVAGVVFIAISLLLLNPLLGLVVLIGAPIVVWLMGALSGRYARASREYQTLLAGTVARATDLVTGYRVIRGIRAETEATRRYQDASRETLHGAYRSVGALGRFLAGSDTISGVFIAGIAALSVWFAVTGQLSIGGMIAAVGLTQALLPPMQMLTGNALPTWAAG
ncbi:MAG: ABC transporter transmembrane domain-containing protein, partial [Microbacterium sp.]